MAKIRIKTLTQELVPINDRLVNMDIEFKQGPQEPHSGPFLLEVTLRNKDDVQSLKDYMDRLLGMLPLPEKKVYKKDAEVQDEAHIEHFLLELKKETPNQKSLIETLRSRNFIMVDRIYLRDYEIAKFIPKKFKDLAFMVRRFKEAKTPGADKWDPQLIFGFNLEEQTPVKIWLYEKLEKWDLPGSEDGKKFKLKRSEFMKFPKYMVLEERAKYQAELRKIKLDPEHKKSKLFLRFEKAVNKLNTPK